MTVTLMLSKNFFLDDGAVRRVRNGDFNCGYPVDTGFRCGCLSSAKQIAGLAVDDRKLEDLSLGGFVVFVKSPNRQRPTGSGREEYRLVDLRNQFGRLPADWEKVEDNSNVGVIHQLRRDCELLATGRDPDRGCHRHCIAQG